jgi:hypothetical protein
MNALVPIQEQIKSEWEAAGRPTLALDYRYFDTPEKIERLLDPSRHVTPLEAEDIKRQLRDAQMNKSEREARRLPDRPVTDPNEPETAGERVYREINDDTIARAAYERSSEGRSDRTLRLLEEIRDLLKARA